MEKIRLEFENIINRSNQIRIDGETFEIIQPNVLKELKSHLQTLGANITIINENQEMFVSRDYGVSWVILEN